MSKAEFLADVRAARAELAGILDRTDKRTLSEAMVPGLSWTAKDVLAHLSGYDLAILKAIADVRAGRSLQWPWTDPGFDTWNERNVAPRRSKPFVAVRAEVDASRTAVLEELETWPADAGPFGPDSWDQEKSEISWLASHEREHTEMIAKLGALPR